MSQLEFRRSDGKPFKILARGDCTSRRLVKMNPQFFPDGVTFIQSQKSPFVLHLDTLHGSTATKSALEEISIVSEMPKTLAGFYLGQADRTILDETDADLLIMDSYADQNFELYEHRADGYKVWIHPKFLRDRERFDLEYLKLGRRSLEESIEDAVRLIRVIRIKNPDIPVLFLNQQVEFYPKLHNRLEYYNLGRTVADRVKGVRAARVLGKEELALDDIGSCGPGLTLHWQKETYADMLHSAYAEVDTIISTTKEEKLGTTGASASTKINGIEPPEDAYEISFQSGAATCNEKCAAFVEKSIQSLDRYTYSDTTTEVPKYTPMIIEHSEIQDMEKWETHIKSFSSGNRIREKKKAISKGYYTKRYSPRQHIPDMFDIDTSLEARSGGKMRGNYVRSIDERGGAPEKLYPPTQPACPLHWSIAFGVFEAAAGHTQGVVVTDEKLIAYLSLRRTGEIVTYAQIMGHGDYLNDGVMVLLHHDVIQWLGQSDEPMTAGIKLIMYGGQENGGPGLRDWKRRSGFTPRAVKVLP